MLTKKQIQGYVKNPNHCPFCGSNNIEGAGQDEINGDQYFMRIDCLVCGHSWDDVYTLNDVSDTYPEPNKPILVKPTEWDGG